MTKGSGRGETGRNQVKEKESIWQIASWEHESVSRWATEIIEQTMSSHIGVGDSVDKPQTSTLW